MRTQWSTSAFEKMRINAKNMKTLNVKLSSPFRWNKLVWICWRCQWYFEIVQYNNINALMCLTYLYLCTYIHTSLYTDIFRSSALHLYLIFDTVGWIYGLYPINVKTAKLIWPNIFLYDPKKVFGRNKMKKIDL